MALWTYATIDGVGSARQLAKLCGAHDAYRWLLGDVAINYHTLADFRTDHVELLDRLLTESVAALMAEGLVDLERVAQDGMRVRASAGAASFRRRPTLEEALARPRPRSGRCGLSWSRTRRPATAGDRRPASGPPASEPIGVQRCAGSAAGVGSQEEAGGSREGAMLDDRRGRDGDEDGRRRLPAGVQPWSSPRPSAARSSWGWRW